VRDFHDYFTRIMNWCVMVVFIKKETGITIASANIEPVLV